MIVRRTVGDATAAGASAAVVTKIAISASRLINAEIVPALLVPVVSDFRQ